MNKFIEKGFLLKAILVKNFGETKGKANQQGIWRSPERSDGLQSLPGKEAHPRT